MIADNTPRHYLAADSKSHDGQVPAFVQRRKTYLSRKGEGGVKTAMGGYQEVVAWDHDRQGHSNRRSPLEYIYLHPPVDGPSNKRMVFSQIVPTLQVPRQVPRGIDARGRAHGGLDMR